ncbi:MIP18 family protein F45G2.10 [Sarcoptes scabiei]|uniref:MIP18 family-like domain-containing protein n=1 Tax=Sarcoptes scabiei TaxID=52283 RepID=A0A834R5T4_SARSC|nr:MIP18 family protein F45G2.10 [Sarcoptes scabiei]
MMNLNHTKDNINPIVYEVKRERKLTKEELDDNVTDEIDAREIFDLIRGIKDPEHPLTLEELNVVQEDHITIDAKENIVEVIFTPTIEHCSLASLIGLCIQVKLLRSLPPNFKIMVKIAPGSHSTEAIVNKQLADKERVAAALENHNLLAVINQCLDASF